MSASSPPHKQSRVYSAPVPVPGDHSGALEVAKVIRVDHLRLPIHVCLGQYEACSQEELHDLVTDLTYELSRHQADGSA